jgi:hypothetical protein
MAEDRWQRTDGRGQTTKDTVEGRCPKDQLFGCCLSGAWEMATEEDFSGLQKAISGFILIKE